MANHWTMVADAATASGAAAATTAAAAPAATTTSTATTEGQAAPAGASRPEGALSGLMMPILLIAIFYFMFLRPQQRKEKERRKMIEQLRTGARVVFAGGLVGVIKEAKEKTFVIECADGACVEALRSCVQGVDDTTTPAATR